MQKAILLIVLAFALLYATQALTVTGTAYNHLRRVGEYYDPEGWFYMTWGIPDDGKINI